MTDLDFVLQLEDLPNKNKPLLADLLAAHPSGKTKPPKEVASEFLGQFNEDYKTGKVDSLAFLTDFAFHRLSDEPFREKAWPALESFEEGLRLHEHTRLLYQELQHRHAFTRLQNSVDVGTRCLAWSNYLQLFKALGAEQATLHECELPPKWVTEVLDESLYQFHNFCLYLARLRKDDPAYAELQARRQELPSFTTFESALKDLIKRTGVQEAKGELLLEEKPRTRHFFGYFGYLALIKLYISHGYVPEAFALIQGISAQAIKKIFSRSWGALISLFYYSGLTYLLSGEILKGTRLLEKCCAFFARYRHFLSKSLQADKYARLVDRATLLLAICLSFNKIETEDSVTKAIAEKHFEKFSKLLKYDQQTFEETFVQGCCKITKPFLQTADLESYVGQESAVDLVPAYVQKMLVQLNKYRILNGIETVLLIYSRVSLAKLSKILGLAETEVEQYLKEYETTRQALPRESVFEKSFLQHALTHLQTHSFQLVGKEVEVRELDPVKPDAETTLHTLIQELSQATAALRSSN